MSAKVGNSRPYASPQVFLSALGIANVGRDSLAWDEATLAALAHLLGRPLQELASIAPQPASHNTILAFGAHAVPRDALERQSLAFCPPCLAEHGFYRAAWRLKLLTGCAEHGCGLVDRCPQCGKALTWRRAELFECRCGFDLRLATAPELRAGVCRLNWHLMALIEGGGEAAGPPPAALAGLSLGDALRVLELVHRIRIPVAAGEAHRALTSMSRCERHEAIEGVASVLAGWPDAFWDLLDRVGAATDEESGICVKTVYGAIYHQLYAPLNQDRYRPVRCAFERFIEVRFGARVSRRGRPLAVRAAKSEDVVTLAAAAASVGLSREVIRRQIHQGQLRARRVRSGHSYSYRIPVAELLKREIATRCERAAARERAKKAAARRLAVCPATIEALIRAGLLDFKSDRPAADLLARCEAMDRAPAAPPPSDLVPFRIAMVGTLCKRKVTLAEVVREVNPAAAVL